ncbi:PQQ-binding-like beta-propeller repeat protein [Streptosporangium lutulentum]|uniref:Pyrrolo-quinoline quinone repeat domain-containing protein n=1 Tax=Streptosporangium lutulentum TaxID=1461250 RepID=A0ABT9QKE3_9ACTN|nr:PQQ-binding-like beta-propeller repeat protein [Streptosporangium lutulentum]MDP9847184.1 hypothetical protein [Streptosporangium lutulentum]
MTGIASCAVLVAFTAISPAHADYSQQARPSWEPNGSVYAIQRAGDRVVIGGAFTSLFNRRTGETVSANRLAAFDAASGDLLRGWNPAANNTVEDLAVSSDEATLYVGGRFTSVDGQTRTRLAAVEVGDGDLVPGWTPTANSTVRALSVIGDRLYLGGDFTNVSGSGRARLAALNASSGALVNGWNPGADTTVDVLEPGSGGTSLLVGGLFRQLGGQSRDYLGSVDPSTGAVTTWRPPAVCINSNPCRVWDLGVMDGGVYAAVGGPGGRLAAYNASSGALRWQIYSDGDVESIGVRDGKVYAGGHFAPSFGTVERWGLAAVDAAGGTIDAFFAPRLNVTLSTYAVDAGPDQLRVGGQFQQVNGQPKARYAEFPLLSSPTAVVSSGSAWRYSDTGADPGAGWQTDGFDDTSWPSGAAQLGFGDGDEATTMASGRIAYHLRHTFTVTDASRLTQAALDLVRDDGAVVYLNGVEILRSNMPAGTVTAQTFASGTVGDADESAWYSTPVNPGLLRTGQNVLAVEVHQAAANSSDVSFDARLTVR